MLIVQKLPWGNTLKVTKAVEKAMHEMQPALHGIDVDTRDLPRRGLHRHRDPQPDAARC